MTTLETSVDAGLARPGNGETGHVAKAFTELQRAVRRSKARLAAADDVESATRMVLRTIALDGPIRTSALAAAVQADLSTVSRQVTVLVARGLLERHADPDDGRASLLVVTDAGHAAIAAHEHVRQDFFAQTLEGWSTVERMQFAHLLSRFAAAYDDVHSRWMGDASPRSHRTEQPEESTAE